jgi:hypothetical protein
MAMIQGIILPGTSLNCAGWDPDWKAKERAQQVAAARIREMGQIRITFSIGNLLEEKYPHDRAVVTRKYMPDLLRSTAMPLLVHGQLLTAHMRARHAANIKKQTAKHGTIH